MSIKSEKLAARNEAIETLRGMLKPGSKVTTTVLHVARSGMSRTIKLQCVDKDGDIRDISERVATALEWPFDHKRWGVKAGGCGMDMCFHAVYTLSSVLFRDVELPAPYADKSPGYALKYVD